MWAFRVNAVAATAVASAALVFSAAEAGETAQPSPRIVIALDDTSRPGASAPAAAANFQVNLCNKSAYQPIFAMAAYRFNVGDQYLTAAGWFRIDGATCRPFRGSFGSNSKVFFEYYAEWSGGKRVWEGNQQSSVCVNAKKAFRRALIPGYQCGSDEKLVKVHTMWIERSAPVQSVNLN
jgi:hypothetical protein